MIDGTQKVNRAIIVASFARSVQIVQVVPIVKSPFLILPRDALIVTHNPHGWRLGAWTWWFVVQNEAA
jgi:hypothetical protein